MTMRTEAEARKCWCPFARDRIDNGGNRAAYGGEGESADPLYGAEMAALYPCITSECMAWRWGESEMRHESTTVYDIDGKEQPAPDGDGWKRGHRTKSALSSSGVFYFRDVAAGPGRLGYCGLAGKP